jgi:hypothetical protein
MRKKQRKKQRARSAQRRVEDPRLAAASPVRPSQALLGGVERHRPPAGLGVDAEVLVVVSEDVKRWRVLHRVQTRFQHPITPRR